MAKKLFKIAGFLALAVAIAAIGMTVWYGINASRNTDIAQPYFEAQLPVILGWDLEALDPMLTPSLRASFSTAEGQRVFRTFATLGTLESFEQLQYIGRESEVVSGEQTYDLLMFSMLGHFSAGDAQVLITLAQSGDSYLLHGLNIRSNALTSERINE